MLLNCPNLFVQQNIFHLLCSKFIFGYFRACANNVLLKETFFKPKEKIRALQLRILCKVKAKRAHYNLIRNIWSCNEKIKNKKFLSVILQNMQLGRVFTGSGSVFTWSPSSNIKVVQLQPRCFLLPRTPHTTKPKRTTVFSHHLGDHYLWPLDIPEFIASGVVIRLFFERAMSKPPT